MTGVHQLEQNQQVFSVEGADAVIQSARIMERLLLLVQLKGNIALFPA